jgi:hypothetical protein
MNRSSSSTHLYCKIPPTKRLFGCSSDMRTGQDEWNERGDTGRENHKDYNHHDILGKIVPVPLKVRISEIGSSRLVVRVRRWDLVTMMQNEVLDLCQISYRIKDVKMRRLILRRPRGTSQEETDTGGQVAGVDNNGSTCARDLPVSPPANGL